MRTKEFKIKGKSITAVLLAGGPGFKIYAASELNSLILKGRRMLIAPEGSTEYAVAMEYVNSPYISSITAKDVAKSNLEFLLRGGK